MQNITEKDQGFFKSSDGGVFQRQYSQEKADSY